MDALHNTKILVVDDAEPDRMLISSYLQQRGCRLYHAIDGLDGIHKAKLLIPDLILMDLDMPKCNGYSACRNLAEKLETAAIPVIFLSAYSETEQRIQGFLSGGVDFIGKPYNFDEVKLRIAVHLKKDNRLENVVYSHADFDAKKYELEYKPNDNVDAVLFNSACLYLMRSLEEPPSLQELAKLVGTNSKRLNLAFKKCAGVTVYEYLREERMVEARRLLFNTHFTISEIAEKVGFSSNANFSTAFKERFGMPPSKFRSRQLQSNGE
ncbi:response regulator transcription factor [Halomonas sp. LS-001]